ncbi:MAG: hypothetical protein MUF34_14295 [Polyangiaceae bacterium]|jgi:hypothetical protein|nr:hypothetical protein [Polyangiaceae bacterium]
MARKRSILTVLLLSAPTTTLATAALASPPAPPPDASAPAELLALRSELYEAGRDKAQAQTKRFRPLCDRDGYPLVGNVMNKSVTYQPSQFCSDVRKAAR